MTEDEVNTFYSHKSMPITILAKEAHKKAFKKANAKWYEMLMNDSDSENDDGFDLASLKENLADLTYKTNFKPKTRVVASSLRKIIPRSEKDHLKTTNFQRLAQINWVDIETEQP